MDEDQATLFEQRFWSFAGSDYTLEDAIALMNDFPIDACDSSGMSFLHLMGSIITPNDNATELTLQIVRTLVERGHNINIGSRKFDAEDDGLQSTWTPICTAVSCAGNVDSIVTLLLELGADVQENAALSACIRFGCNPHLIPILLEAGALVEGYESDVVPIDLAPIHKSLHTLKTLNEAGNRYFPYTYELLFAKEPYCATGTDNNIYGGVECLSYLINWNWKGFKEAKEDVDALADRQKEYESFSGDDLKTGFDIETASDEWLDPDPRLRWLRRAILKQPKPMPILDKEQQQQLQKENHHHHMLKDDFFLSNTRRPLLNSLKEMFSRKKQDSLYPAPSRPHAIPLHRALSCDVKFCSWMGQEGYIRALATVDPTALEEADEITGLYAFQLAALRKGDLDSSYQFLRMCPCLLEVKQDPTQGRKEKGCDEGGSTSRWWSWLPNDASSREGRGMKISGTSANSGGGLLQRGKLCGGFYFLSYHS